MAERPDLAQLLTELEQAVPAVDEAAVPALVVRLAAILAVAGARLAVPVVPDDRPAPADFITDIAEVARLARRSVSWVRKNGHTLPGFSQPRGKRTKVAWSRRALEVWVTTPAT